MTAELFVADRIVTGADGVVVDHGAVLVDGSSIVAAGEADEVRNLPEAAGAKLSELRDQTLLPGLIDCHVHLGFDASDAPVRHMMEASDLQLVEEMLRSARRLVAAGVTTARDLGARGHLALVVQEAVEGGRAAGPRLVVANAPITTTGGHCWFMGCERDDREGLRRAVREHHKAGAQVIKVMATGGFMTAGSAPWDAQFGLDELRTVVDEAHRLGKPVAAHAHGLAGLRNAVEAGVDTIEHCSWASRTGAEFDEELVAAIVDRGIFVCPTTNVKTLLPAAQRRSQWGMAVAAPPELIEGRLERLRRMREAGVRLVAGTDAGVNLVPHGAYAGGLKALAATGMTPIDVLVAATSRAAAACGVSSVTGSLEAGKEADLVAVEGDPTTDLSALDHPSMVMTRGHRYDPAEC